MSQPSNLKVKRLVELDALPPGTTGEAWMYAVRNAQDHKVLVADLVAEATEVAIDEAVAEAGEYTDQEVAAAVSQAEQYTDQEVGTVLIDANAHADSVGDAIREELLDPEDSFGTDMVAYELDTGMAVTRSLRSKLGDVVSVKDFGATGDGATSDSAAINAALAYANASGGAKVVVPAGNYRLTHILRIGSNTTLSLDSGAVFLKDHDATFINTGLGYNTSSVIPAYGGHKNIVIEGGVWEGFSYSEIYDGYTGFAIGFASNVIIRNLTLLDSISPGHAVDMAASEDVLFENVKFMGHSGPGIDLSLEDCIQLDACVEGSFPYFGVPCFIQCRRITVRNCYFGPNPANTDIRFGPHAVGVSGHAAVAGQWATDIVVDGCTFEDTLSSGVRVFKWKRVSITNNKFVFTGDGNGKAIHITAVSAGTLSSQDIDRVQTDQAEAGGDITITGNAVEGAGASQCVLAPQPTFGTDTTVRTRNVTITGNTFRDVTGSLCLDLRAIDNLSITGNAFYNTLCPFDTSSVGVSNVTFANNTIDGVSSDHAFRWNASSNGLSLSNNVFKNVAGRALLFTGSAVNASVDGNVFIDWGMSSAFAAVIAQSSAAGIAIRNNTFTIINSTTTQPCINILGSAGAVQVGAQMNNTALATLTTAASSTTYNGSGSETLSNLVVNTGSLQYVPGLGNGIKVKGASGATAWVNSNALFYFINLTADLTVDPSHVGRTLRKFNSTARTVTVPESDAIPVGSVFYVGNAGATTNDVTVVAGGSVIIYDGGTPGSVVIPPGHLRKFLKFNTLEWQVL